MREYCRLGGVLCSRARENYRACPFLMERTGQVTLARNLRLFLMSFPLTCTLLSSMPSIEIIAGGRAEK